MRPWPLLELTSLTLALFVRPLGVLRAHVEVRFEGQRVVAAVLVADCHFVQELTPLAFIKGLRCECGCGCGLGTFMGKT